MLFLPGRGRLNIAASSRNGSTVLDPDTGKDPLHLPINPNKKEATPPGFEPGIP